MYLENFYTISALSNKGGVVFVGFFGIPTVLFPAVHIILYYSNKNSCELFVNFTALFANIEFTSINIIIYYY